MVQCRRGGGFDPVRMAMGVAPGGLIKQCILDDTNPAEIWERDRTICFNVQILNSDMFQQVTGKAPPSTPISAKTYADQGLPFYKIYGETSSIKGDFNGVKSVKELDKLKNKNGKRENEGDGALESNKKAKDLSDEDDEDDIDEEEDSIGKDDTDEEEDSIDRDDTKNDNLHDDQQASSNPVLLLNPNGTAMGQFTPVSELVEELSRMKLRKTKPFHAKK